MARRRGKQQSDEATEPAAPEVEGVRHRGPWDSSERTPGDDETYLDLGPLKVRVRVGLDVQLPTDGDGGEIGSVVLVAGNHDRHEDWALWRDGLDVRSGDLVEPPFVFAHEPCADARGYVVAGHIHPVFRDRELFGARGLRVFWQRRQCIVLPSWGEFTGGFRVRPAPDEGLYACTPEGVLALQTGRPT
jgi:hypothetical protein